MTAGYNGSLGHMLTYVILKKKKVTLMEYVTQATDSELC